MTIGNRPTAGVLGAGEETATGDPRAEAAASDLQSELSRGTDVGRYVILGKIGRGGMGIVYAAYDYDLDRKVALKFLGPDRGEVSVRERRLLREAQAMARLSHPNVVAVYEVSSFKGHVFVAMELVDGVDLRAWLVERARTPSEILDVFHGAGHGLAAAHAAGIIHRDFKPANILVDRRNRPRVTDFGISRATGAQDDQEGEPGQEGSRAEDPAGPSSPSLLAAPLTRTGDVHGTPSYMSPEHRSGAPADARSDQFSFCVALYEALHGEHPFKGTDTHPFLTNLLAGRVSPPPSRSPVARWRRQAILRGLRRDPDERFPSMEALLAALTVHPHRRRRRILAALAAGLLLAGGTAYGLSLVQGAGAPLPRCDLGADHLARVWNPTRRHQVRSAFEAAGVAGTAVAWDAFSRTLDRHAASWVEMYADACTATHVRGVQSPAVLDLRAECLDRKLLEMKALADVYSEKIDKATLDRAQAAAENLSPIAACADVANLRAVVPLPEEPGIRAKVLDVDRRLGRARALDEAGRYKEGYELAASLKPEADPLAYPPLNADIANAMGNYLGRSGKAAEAETILFEGVAQAVQGRDSAREAQAWIALVINYGRLGRVQEGLLAARMAEMVVERANGDAALRARLMSAAGYVESNAGRYEDAFHHYERAAELWRTSLGTSSRRFASALGSMGGMLESLGRLRESLPVQERALALKKAILRPDDPDIAYSLHGVGDVYHLLGRIQEALDAYRAAFEIRRKELGPEHTDTIITLTSVAAAEANLGHHDRALQLYAEILATELRVFDPDDVFIGTTYVGIGEALKMAGRLDEAEKNLKLALAHQEKIGAVEHFNTADALTMLGEIHNLRNEHGRALQACRRGLAILRKEIPEESSRLIVSRTCIGEALIGTGDLAAASEALDQALRLVGQQDVAPQNLAPLQFQLARALWAKPAERARARELAGAAVASLRAAEGNHRALVSRAEDWLESHPGR